MDIAPAASIENIYYTEAHREKVRLIEFSGGKTKTLYCSVYFLYLHVRAYKYLRKFMSKNQEQSCFVRCSAFKNMLKTSVRVVIQLVCFEEFVLLKEYAYACLSEK